MSSGRRSRRRSRRKALAACRDGDHRYGSPHAIVGGILRQTCTVCGAVSIDITNDHEPTSLSAPQSRQGNHLR